MFGFLGLYLADFVVGFTTTDSLRLDNNEKQAIYLLTGDSGFPVTEVNLSLIYQVAHILHSGKRSIRYYQSGNSVFLTDRDLFRSEREHYTIFSEDEAIRDQHCNTNVGVYPYRGNSCIVRRNGQIFIDSYIP